MSRAVEVVEAGARGLGRFGFHASSVIAFAQRNPSLCLEAICVIALGVAVNTVMFSLVETVVLNPLPLPRPKEVVEVFDAEQVNVSPVVYLEMKGRMRSYSSLSAATMRRFNLTRRGEALSIVGAMVTPEFFETLRVNPALGRAFLQGRGAAEDGSGLVLSHALWASKFESRRDVIGESVALDGIAHVIVGVTGRECQLPQGAEAWVTPGLGRVPRFAGSLQNADDAALSEEPYLTVFGRLRQGVTPEEAEAEARLVSAKPSRGASTSEAIARIRVERLQERMVAHIRAVAVSMYVAGSFILILVCVNVANLLLAKAIRGARESATRLALGATPARLAIEHLVQGLALAIGGMGAGLGLSLVLLSIVRRVVPATLPRAGEIGLSGQALAYMTFVTVVTSCGAALLGGVRARGSQTSALIRGGHQSAERGRLRLQAALVVVQVALAVPLVVGTAVMLRSFWKVTRQNPGFDAKHALVFELPIAPIERSKGTEIVELHRALLRRFRAVAGVTSAGITNALPLGFSEMLVGVAGSPMSAEGAAFRTSVRFVSAGYVEALGIPLRRGRLFDERDRDGSAPVAIVDELLARRLWEDGRDLGMPVWTHLTGKEPVEVVGVVDTVRASSLEADPRPTLYLPFLQAPPEVTTTSGRSMTYVLRTAGEGSAVAGEVRRIVRETDDRQPVAGMAEMEDIVARSMRSRTVSTMILVAFASVAVFLAIAGVHGVVAQSVAQRRRELGIRAALGATPLQLLRLASSQTLRAAGVGILLGLIATAALLGRLSVFVYDSSALETGFMLVFSCLAMAAVALGTAAFAAREVLSVNPAIVLRQGA